MKINLKNVALIFRKDENGKMLIIGSSLEIPEIITTDNEFLIFGSLEIETNNIYTDYLKDGGNTPNDLISGGVLNYNLYLKKVKV